VSNPRSEIDKIAKKCVIRKNIKKDIINYAVRRKQKTNKRASSGN
jgi:hypothetical protein